MDFILGAGFAVALFCCLTGAYMLGQVKGQKQKDTSNDFELDEDEAERRDRAKRLKKGFDEMMAYNEAKARKG
jgi:hypothetical protein